jgi:hypothetical protein
MEKNCSKCGQIAVYKEGTNKEGKKYAGYFCQDKDDCKNVDWIKLKMDEKPIAKPIQSEPVSNDIELLKCRTQLMSAIVRTETVSAKEIFEDLWKTIIS